MSSSESEDDCYGNVAAKLNLLKNNYKDDKIETTNLLNDSSEFDDIVKNYNKTKKTVSKRQQASSSATPGPSVSDDLDISDEVIAENLLKRVTRSRARKSKSEKESVQNAPPDPSPDPALAPTTPGPSKRRKTRPSPSQPTIDELFDQFLEPMRRRNARGSSTRSRSRRRGRGGRRNMSIAQAVAAVYSIGDADEAYDHSAGQQLFSKTKKDDVVLVEEDDPLDENEELLVKVYWQSCDVFKFKIRRFQKITQIFEYFSEKNQVGFDNLYFTYNDSILKSDDTPESIDYNIAKFIDGGIVNQSLSSIRNEKDSIKNGVCLKFQCQNMKKPFEITVRPADKFSLAMMKCSEHLETPLSKLKFELDGDSIAAQSTIEELDLESGDCIDVKVLS